eukprot:s3255_g10.t1
MRISQVTVTTKKGQKIEATSSEDEQEIKAEKILLEPWVSNTEGLDKEQTTEGMKQEIKSMKEQGVYTEVHISQLTPEQRKKIIKSRWVLRQKGNTVRARIVAKGYTEEINDNDDIFASTPIFCVFRVLLVLALCNNWICLTGDISTVYLHAAAATADLFIYPPTGFYNAFDQIVWRLSKAIYGLRKQPKSMAKSPRRGDATTWTSTTCQRAQRLRNTTVRCIHTMLRRRLALHWTTGDGQQAVQEHSATPSTSSNRRTHSRQHHQLSGQKPFWAETSATKVTIMRSA